jgi:hypothetical protein
MRLSQTLGIAWLLLIGIASGVQAQNAQLNGVVKDQTGGVMPGVTVTVRNQQSGLVRTAVTDGEGEYRVPALPPAAYTIVAELQGFGTETRTDIVLAIEQTATVNFTMRTATVAETVTVTGDSPIVDTSRSDVSTSVSTQQIDSLPVASRRWVELAMLTPAVSQDNIRGQFYPGTVNIGAGTRSYSNAYVVDGVNNTWAEMGEPRQNFAMNSIQEFKVTTSTFKAEYGLATGGLLTVVSKSGTNQFHGEGLTFFRDQELTARTYFQDVAPGYSRNQWGGSAGGPLVRDKTHFFFAYERTNEKQFLTVNTNGTWPQYDGTYPSDQYNWAYTGKVDHQLSSSQSLFVRFAQENEYRPINNAGGRLAPSGAFDFSVPRKSLAAGETWIMTPRALNELRFQYAYAISEVAMPYSHGEWQAGDLNSSRLGLCTSVFSYPSLQIGNCNSQMGPESRWEVKDDFSYALPNFAGRHQFKTGVDFSYIPFGYDNTNGYAGQWTFPKDQPYNASDPTTWPTQYTQSLPQYGFVPVKHLSLYVQDDWELASNLTLNLGLRYDAQPGAFDEDLAGTLANIGQKLGPQFAQYPLPIPFINTSQRGDWDNFGPRIGLAWDPGHNSRTNVHAGYGLFYDNIRTLTNFQEFLWPQGQMIIINHPSFPDPLQGLSRNQFISTAPPNITVLANDSVNPYAHQYNAGLTQMLTPSLAVTADVTVVARYSDRDTVDQNLPDLITGVKPYPQFGRVSTMESTANNTYRALLLKIEKRMSNNFQFLASYTLSKAVDSDLRNSQGDIYGFARIDSPSVGDRRHRLVVSGIVQLPHAMHLSAVGDFRSSLPFNPTTPLDLNHDGYTGDNAPGVAYYSGCRDLNMDAVNAFRAARGLAAVSSSDIACPAFANVDVRFAKSLRLPGSQRIELIAQVFNVFNRANFATPNASVTSTGFGQVNQILPYINAPSRELELAVRYQF